MAVWNPLTRAGINCGCLIGLVSSPSTLFPLEIRGFAVSDKSGIYAFSTSQTGRVRGVLPTIGMQGGGISIEWDFSRNPTLPGFGGLVAGMILPNLYLFPWQSAQGAYDGPAWWWSSIVVTDVNAVSATTGGANVTSVAFQGSGTNTGSLNYPTL